MFNSIVAITYYNNYSDFEAFQTMMKSFNHEFILWFSIISTLVCSYVLSTLMLLFEKGDDIDELNKSKEEYEKAKSEMEKVRDKYTKLLGKQDA